MALIIRIDVDRPYGRRPMARHVLSRLSSDFYFPKVAALGYLSELHAMLNLLNSERARAYVFYRRCTLPSPQTRELMERANHVTGLHLENSRSIETFQNELRLLERHTGQKIVAVSKHGSGGAKYGYHHYAPYEPEKYVTWAQQASMRLLLGNLEDPSLEPVQPSEGLLFFPSAFWLEPHWRNTKKFPIEWLVERARVRDTVLLVHPENVFADSMLTADFKHLIRTLDSKIL